MIGITKAFLWCPKKAFAADIAIIGRKQVKADGPGCFPGRFSYVFSDSTGDRRAAAKTW